MATKPKAFVDSNILANWMLLDAAIRELTPKGESALKDLRELTSAKNPSYLLLKELLPLGKQLSYTFGTSTLAVSETTHVILEEYIYKRLHDKGVPFRYWSSLQNRQQLSHDDETDLFRQIQRFLSSFFPTSKGPLRWYDKYDVVDVSILIGMYRLGTSDAILVAEAEEARCKYFVTEDEPLRRLLKKHVGIKPLSAQAMLDEIKGATMPR